MNPKQPFSRRFDDPSRVSGAERPLVDRRSNTGFNLNADNILANISRRRFAKEGKLSLADYFARVEEAEQGGRPLESMEVMAAEFLPQAQQPVAPQGTIERNVLADGSGTDTLSSGVGRDQLNNPASAEDTIRSMITRDDDESRLNAIARLDKLQQEDIDAYNQLSDGTRAYHNTYNGFRYRADPRPGEELEDSFYSTAIVEAYDAMKVVDANFDFARNRREREEALGSRTRSMGGDGRQPFPTQASVREVGHDSTDDRFRTHGSTGQRTVDAIRSRIISSNPANNESAMAILHELSKDPDAFNKLDSNIKTFYESYVLRKKLMMSVAPETIPEIDNVIHSESLHHAREAFAATEQGNEIIKHLGNDAASVISGVGTFFDWDAAEGFSDYIKAGLPGGIWKGMEDTHAAASARGITTATKIIGSVLPGGTLVSAFGVADDVAKRVIEQGGAEEDAANAARIMSAFYVVASAGGGKISTKIFDAIVSKKMKSEVFREIVEATGETIGEEAALELSKIYEQRVINGRTPGPQVPMRGVRHSKGVEGE